MDNKKIFIVDTSVLVHDPYCIENLGDNIIVIPIWVIEELDRLKKFPDQKGFDSRTASQKIDDYRKKGKLLNVSLRDGVPTENGGTIRITYTINGDGYNKDLPLGLENTNDNKIMTVALNYKKDYPNAKIFLISKDVNLRLKAEACGIEAEDYQNDMVLNDIEKLYKGFVEIELKESTKKWKLMNEWFSNLCIPFSDIEEDVDINKIFDNQCCVFKMNGNDKSIMSVCKINKGCFRVIRKNDFTEIHTREKGKKITPKNMEQLFAFCLLLDPEVRIMALTGKAGTGKTLLALNAAISQLSKIYDDIIVYRPNIELGNPLGFLPGDISEKFNPWTKPIFDNLNVVFETQTEKKKALLDSGLFSIEPINFIRGRSLNKSFIIIDEAQNLKPLEVKTIVTRIGKGSKMVFTGDVQQIDTPYLNSLTNGLSYLIERLKGEFYFANIKLKRSERDEIVELVTQKL